MLSSYTRPGFLRAHARGIHLPAARRVLAFFFLSPASCFSLFFSVFYSSSSAFIFFRILAACYGHVPRPAAFRERMNCFFSFLPLRLVFARRKSTICGTRFSPLRTLFLDALFLDFHAARLSDSNQHLRSVIHVHFIETVI